MHSVKGGVDISNKKVSMKVCDVEKCGLPAAHVCAGCGIDLCDRVHTYSFGDGGHLEHAISITVITWSHGGPEQIWMCPKCWTTPLSESLFDIFKKSGIQLEHHDGMG